MIIVTLKAHKTPIHGRMLGHRFIVKDNGKKIAESGDYTDPDMKDLKMFMATTFVSGKEYQLDLEN